MGRKILFLAVLVAFGLGTAFFAFSEDGLKNPLGSTKTFSALISKIAEIVAQIGLPIAAIVIIYSGFLFATAGGSEEKIKKAKSTFFWGIIGTALVLGAWGISLAIEEFVTKLK